MNKERIGARKNRTKKSRAKAGATKGFFLMWKYNLSDAVPHYPDALYLKAVHTFSFVHIDLLYEFPDKFRGKLLNIRVFPYD